MVCLATTMAFILYTNIIELKVGNGTNLSRDKWFDNPKLPQDLSLRTLQQKAGMLRRSPLFVVRRIISLVFSHLRSLARGIRWTETIRIRIC